MSGGSSTPTDGGHGFGGGPQGPPGSFDCTSFTEEVTLVSPNPEVLVGLQPGTILSLQAQDPQRGPLRVLSDNGGVAGSIVGAVVGQLLRCIEQGHQYVARVILVDGGRCIVEIRSA